GTDLPARRARPGAHLRRVRGPIAAWDRRDAARPREERVPVLAVVSRPAVRRDHGRQRRASLSPTPIIAFALLVAFVYARGARRSRHWPARRSAFFGLGLMAILVALVSS